MISDLSPFQEKIPSSTIYLALFVQNPNVDEKQPIYVRDNLTKGLIQKVAETSLRLFLETTPLTASKKWYDVVKIMEIPEKGEITIHFWLPKDSDLMLGLLNQNFKPCQNYMGVLATSIFSRSGVMLDFSVLQQKLALFAEESSVYETRLTSIFMS